MFKNHLNSHLIFALMLTAIAPLNNAKTEHQTVSFTGISRIEVHNQCGNITVKTHSHDYVQVNQASTYKKSSEKPEVSNSVKNGTLTIKVEKSKSSSLQQWFTKIFTLFETKSNPQVDHIILLPQEKWVDAIVNVGYGNIHTTKTNGNIKADIGNGIIDINEIHGSIKANAGKGTINIVKATRNIEANIGIGDINIKNYLGEANISLQTAFGSILCPHFFKNTNALMVNIAGGIIGDGKYQITANTGMGSIVLTDNS